MSIHRWMLYGATGYTGILIAEEAVRRGHQPILAGRSAVKLKALAERLHLDYRAVDLGDPVALRNALADVDLVVHAAGPFVHTSPPMLDACLATRTHYLDITGELPVFDHTFAHDAVAREQGILLLSGAGFDVVPTDCLARFVADRLPNASTLQLAIAAVGQASAGTTKTMLEMMGRGGRARVNGTLMPIPIGIGSRKVRFSDRTRRVVPIPWGDLETAYHTTGIPNITTYMAMSAATVRLLPWLGPPTQQLLTFDTPRRVAQSLVGRVVHGPTAEQREGGRWFVWACAGGSAGEQVEAWLETPDGYDFTARAVVAAVEQVGEAAPCGALTPACAFGADFVLRVAGTRRMEQLPPMSR